VWVLGLNAIPLGWHDASACLVDEHGRIVAFAEEERLTRKKHALQQRPVQAARFCIEQAGIDPREIDVIAVGWDVPYAARQWGMKWSFERTPGWLNETLGWDRSWKDLPDLVFVPHHLAHATSALYASGWDSAGILVVDGNGEVESTSIYSGAPGGRIVRKRVWPRSHSLGWMYDAVSRFIGFRFLEAGKTMGLAGYGRARGLEPWPLMTDEDDGLRPPFAIPDGYTYPQILDAWGKVLADRAAGIAVVKGGRELDQDAAAVQAAWSGQVVIETRVGRLVEMTRAATGHERVCLAGGVALNCAANGLLDEPVYAPPIPHDAGVALGAAWHVAPPAGAAGRPLDPFLGPDIAADMPSADERDGLHVEPLDLDRVREAIAAGKIGAVAEDRAEVGPRALCRRSIIASPADPAMKDRVNAVKDREPWRPFGPVALRGHSAALWEEREHLTRYMIGGLVVSDRGREAIPAAIHVDGTARPQVMEDDAPGLVADLLRRQDGVGALINTSFNVRGQPIVSSGRDAMSAFRAMDLDFLVLGGDLYAKKSGWWRP
jgi:carbamoyltransferase